ncbi:MAG: hypothetical protein OXC41_06865 [Gammaproteobacteria bacterium]|nr:hypothetical protein [Gammaproteobacteria bacterium]
MKSGCGDEVSGFEVTAAVVRTDADLSGQLHLDHVTNSKIRSYDYEASHRNY